MGRKAKDISPLALSKLKDAGMHFVGHVAGLALRVSDTGARSWILRIMVGGKRCDIGLGAYPSIGLSVAKDLALGMRQQVKNGINPLEAKRVAQSRLRLEQASFMSFKQAAEGYISAHRTGWKNPKHAAQWESTLNTYAYPVIGNLHVKDVAVDHVLKVLEPIWVEKTETASRLRGRVEAILDWAKVRGSRTGENPARWKGNLEYLLQAKDNISPVKHHKALDWKDCPEFVQKLRAVEGMSARALELCILTNCRSGEVRGALWSEIDLGRAVWVIPAHRMKKKKEHRVPLSPSALALLKNVGQQDDGLVFSGDTGKPLTDMALLMVLRRMQVDVTVHGFRSTFRDWAGETTAFPREVIEHAMAHNLKDKSEAAYARGDLFTKRAALMKAWSEYLKNTSSMGEVVSINKQNRIKRDGQAKKGKVGK